jgi:hypothetical protein
MIRPWPARTRVRHCAERQIPFGWWTRLHLISGGGNYSSIIIISFMVILAQLYPQLPPLHMNTRETRICLFLPCLWSYRKLQIPRSGGHPTHALLP